MLTLPECLAEALCADVFYRFIFKKLLRLCAEAQSELSYCYCA
jgi:hypothetical protein